MQANRHYKRFPNNVASFEELGVLKTTVISDQTIQVKQIL